MVETINGVDYTTTYLYNTTNNHLEKVTKPDNTTITFLYSPNGNTIAKASQEGTVTYEYNPENQLTKVTKPNGDTVEFTYDGENRRISKTTNGVVTKYVYDGDLISLETDANGKITATYEYDDFGAPVSIIKGGSIYFYHYNGQGDTVALTDANGSIAATYKYDPWGNIIEKTGSVDTPFTYRGKYGYIYDKETNLFFLKSRYYDPEIGRFTTKDRFAGFEDRPASQNKYTYCENDPVNGVDPSGEAGISLSDLYNDLKSILNRKNFKSDWAGRAILTLYLLGDLRPKFGLGDEIVIENNGDWTGYMKANKSLKATMKSYLIDIAKKMRKGSTKTINNSRSVEIENGESITGYNYLHGTNAKAGGFKIKGTAKKDRRSNVVFDLHYQWNDIIDYNPKYRTDIIKESIAYKLSYGHRKPYILRIGWKAKSTYRVSGKHSGWPLK